MMRFKLVYTLNTCSQSGKDTLYSGDEDVDPFSATTHFELTTVTTDETALARAHHLSDVSRSRSSFLHSCSRSSPFIASLPHSIALGLSLIRRRV